MTDRVSRVTAYCLAAALALLSLSASADCERRTRTISYAGDPEKVFISPGQFTEVIFPEELAAVLPERPEGLSFHENAFPDRLFFTTEDKAYVGNVILQGASGQSYHLQLLARQGCADTTVTVERAGDSKTAKKAKKQGLGDAGPQDRPEVRLLRAMVTDQSLRGFDRREADGELGSRMVYEQGPVALFLHEIYEGRRYTGFILLAVNRGRTPYRVALEALDFQSRRIREAFGRVRKITMEPNDFRLDPAPEFASDAMEASHQGIVYIVSEKTEALRGG